MPALPIIAVLAVLVRVTSGTPAFYRQTRVGRHGKTYEMIKIRTMRQDAESETGPVWTEPNDPRVTFIGRILRAAHLDELPQLWNVVRGEMALIGPRPERPEFLALLASEIPGYMDRYAVLPGITGLAQINLPPDTDLDSVRRKLVLDMQYVTGANFWLDLRIFLCTITRLTGMNGLVVAGMLGIRSQPSIPAALYAEKKNGAATPPLRDTIAIPHRLGTVIAGEGGVQCVGTTAVDWASMI